MLAVRLLPNLSDITHRRVWRSIRLAISVLAGIQSNSC